jgi:hypothetical protein
MIKQPKVSGLRSKLGSVKLGRVLAAVGAAVLLAGLGLIGWQGMDYRRQQAEVEPALASWRRALAALPPPGPDLSEERARLEPALAIKFPVELDITALEKAVRVQAKAQGVDVIAFEPLLAEQRGGYRVQSIRIQVMGRPGSVPALAKNLDAIPGLHRVRWDRLAAEQEGFQHQLHWEWYLSLPSPAWQERCPEPPDRVDLQPLRANLFLWIWPQLRDQHQAAEGLKRQLGEARQKAREACRQQVEIESLRGRTALAAKLEQELKQSQPASAD